jgi:adenine-specific DNA-methyltransferase
MDATQTNVAEGLLQSRTAALLNAVETARRHLSHRLDSQRRVVMGQFLTPISVATFMARMVECQKPVVRILDPGAGIGSLSAALVTEMCRRPLPPKVIHLTVYEVDPLLISYLQATVDLCREVCEEAGIRFEPLIVKSDFLEVGASTLAGNLFTAPEHQRFDCAILNPPYRKIGTKSRERNWLRAIGLETTNLYTGFLAMTARLLAYEGEMVAITPRSFCNGSYFEPFRRFFLREMRFLRIHVFDARDRAFADDDVLQENIIFRAIRTTQIPKKVIVSSSLDPSGRNSRIRTVTHEDIVRPGDPRMFIHIVPDGDGDSIREKMISLHSTLEELDLQVSTGRVVDFRAKNLLRAHPGRNTVPLIYPCHLRRGFVEWPIGNIRKAEAFAIGQGGDELLVPAGYYVLVKRFTTKEERRRVVAAVYDPTRVPAERVAFENHLNYYHIRGSGLPATLAKGLAAFLNSTLVDVYFRQFSGHTQVNATDLRSLRYPKRENLIALGRRIGESFPEQEELDRLVEEVVFSA